MSAASCAKNRPMSRRRVPAGVSAPSTATPSRAASANDAFLRALAAHARSHTSPPPTAYRSRRPRASRSRVTSSSCSR